jgi:hypothetical protein
MLNLAITGVVIALAIRFPWLALGLVAFGFAMLVGLIP